MNKFKQFTLGGLAGVAFALSVATVAATVSYFGSGATDQVGFVLVNLIKGEDETNNVMRTETQMSYCANKTADAQCGASGTRFVHTLTCASNDAAATAGSVALSDATAAGSGNVLVIGFPAAYVPAATVIIDATFTTGIYLDFTTTADVSCTVSYR